MPIATLESMIFYSNLLVFTLAGLMTLTCKFFDSKSERMSKSNRYQSSNSHKESEIEFEFASTYNNEEIVQMMDLEFNAKNNKK